MKYHELFVNEKEKKDKTVLDLCVFVFYVLFSSLS